MNAPYQLKTHYRDPVQCTCGNRRWKVQREPIVAPGKLAVWYQGHEPPSRLRMVCVICKRSDSFCHAVFRRTIIKPVWESLLCDACHGMEWTVEAERADKSGGHRVLWDGCPMLMTGHCARCQKDKHHWIETEYIPRANCTSIKIVKPGEQPGQPEARFLNVATCS